MITARMKKILKAKKDILANEVYEELFTKCKPTLREVEKILKNQCVTIKGTWLFILYLINRSKTK